ncbi:hypothetical protein ABZ419_27175 [Streptomyces cinnamoneus]|uniref:hypothetical protein n=1 Tax=Streptomyces cinnamoneus TaxID=53446 RepID=UPI0033C2DC79
MPTIPYTHWAYFPDQASARGCADELLDYVIRIREAEGSQWLLLAGRDVETAGLIERHAEVEAIVVRHGGDYDGGEATYLEGQPVVDPMLTEDP